MNLWVKYRNGTHQITSYNTHFEDGMFQLWVTKSNGRTMKIAESKREAIVDELKGMLDFAVEHNETLVDLNV